MKESNNIAKAMAEKNWNELSRAQREEISKMLEHMDDIRDVNQESYHWSASRRWRG
jgi:hypothetical protein